MIVRITCAYAELRGRYHYWNSSDKRSRQRKPTVSNASKMAKLLPPSVAHKIRADLFEFHKGNFLILVRYFNGLSVCRHRRKAFGSLLPCSVTLPTILCNPRELCSGNVRELLSINMRFDSQSGYRLHWSFCGSDAWLRSWNKKILEGSCLTWRHLDICLEETRKTTKKLRITGVWRDLNPELP
jgi:hypothetical protein